MRKFFEKLVPADHEITAKAVGETNLFKMIVKATWNYRRTMKYLLQHRGFKAFKSFIATKTIVPTGEGSGELAYYFIGGLIRKFPQLAPYPRWIEVEVTTKCNKRCLICEHTWWDMPDRELTLEGFTWLVDQFPKLTWCNLTGEGDAFLNRDYLEMIKYVKEKGVSVYLVDSFNLINRERAFQLVKLGVDGIYISMDGATKSTYEYHKEGCIFENTIKNIKNILEAKRYYKSPIPEICFRFVITNRNYKEMPDFIRLVRSIAPKSEWGDMAKIHFVGLLVFPEIQHLYLPKIPPQILVETVKAVEESPDSLPAVFAHTEPEKFPSINKCLAWMEPYFALVPEPMTLPCCAVLMSNIRRELAKHSFGNWLTQPFKEIWESPRYKYFRHTVNKPNAKVPWFCKGCRSYDTKEREEKFGVDNRL